MGAPKKNKNAVGNKGGRPTKFKKEFIDQLIAFFDIEPYREQVSEYTKEYFVGKNGEKQKVKKISEKFRTIPNRMPTLFRFARKIGVTWVTMLDWCKKGEEIDEKTQQHKHPMFFEFLKAYKEAKEMQKEFLISIGLAGAAPPSSFIFVAKNVTDMRDKTETDLTSGNKPIAGVVLMPRKRTPEEDGVSVD